jgi:hypothetical protein|uniref:Uncharacterized protein n=1 Tax=Zea mays TaxID=4577 RepID=B6TSN8_MAIZE|nr:hypothetical protein [Zea mays]
MAGSQMPQRESREGSSAAVQLVVLLPWCMGARDASLNACRRCVELEGYGRSVFNEFLLGD